MTRRRRRQSSAATPDLTPGQAKYVIGKLISERRVSQSEVSRYLSDMQREISDLEQKLASLRAASGAAGAAQAAPARRPGRPPGRARASEAPAAPAGRRRRSTITAEQQASRKLQGRYLGLIRQIPASRRPQYQRIAKDKGREAAIKEMVSALGK